MILYSHSVLVKCYIYGLNAPVDPITTCELEFYMLTYPGGTQRYSDSSGRQTPGRLEW